MLPWYLRETRLPAPVRGRAVVYSAPILIVAWKLEEKTEELVNVMEKWNIIHPSLQSETKPNANAASRALKSAIGPKILERLINYTFQ